MTRILLAFATLLMFSATLFAENITFINNQEKSKKYNYFKFGKVKYVNDTCQILASKLALLNDGIIANSRNNFSEQDCLALNEVEATPRSEYCEGQAQSLNDYFDVSAYETVSEVQVYTAKIEQLAAKSFVRCMTIGRQFDKVEKFLGGIDSDSDGFADYQDNCPESGDEGLGVDDVGCPIEEVNYPVTIFSAASPNEYSQFTFVNYANITSDESCPEGCISIAANSSVISPIINDAKVPGFVTVEFNVEVGAQTFNDLLELQVAYQGSDVYETVYSTNVDIENDSFEVKVDLPTAYSEEEIQLQIVLKGSLVLVYRNVLIENINVYLNEQ